MPFSQDVASDPLATVDDPIAHDAAQWRNYWAYLPCAYPDISGDLVTVTTASDFVSDRQRRASAMYNEYLRYFDCVDREMTLCLPSQVGRTLRLIFWRGPGADFSERARSLLTLLRPHLHQAYVDRRRRQMPGPLLSARQTQLMELVSAGYTNGQIARRLSISEATVRKHLEHVFERLQVSSRTAAVTRLRTEAPPEPAGAEPQEWFLRANG